MPSSEPPDLLVELRRQAAEAMLHGAPEADLERLFEKVQREFGPVEADRLRGQITEVRDKIPRWMPYALRLNRAMRGWRAYALAVVVLLVVFFAVLLLNG